MLSIDLTPIFIPGLLCTEWLFHRQIHLFKGKALFADTCQHNTIRDMAEAALAKTTGQVLPIGLSMGGYVALEMARLAPSRIAAMALFGTNCRQDNTKQRAKRELAIKMARLDSFSGVTVHFLSKFLSPQALADKALIDGILMMAANVGSEVFARQQYAILERTEQNDTLAAFMSPLLIVCGMDDTLTPPHLSEEMYALAPNADLRLLPNVGHLSVLEAPEVCNAALNDLMQRI